MFRFLISKVIGKEKTTTFFIKNTISIRSLLRWKRIRASLDFLIQEKQISLNLKSKKSTIEKSRYEKKSTNLKTQNHRNSEGFSQNSTLSPIKQNKQFFNQNNKQDKQLLFNNSQITPNKTIDLSNVINVKKKNSIENVLFPQQDELLEQQDIENDQDVSSNDQENADQFQEDVASKYGVIQSTFHDGVFEKQNKKILQSQK
ncbi:hypothetical protein TTHERM_00971720 (macronuclear) [Tetrahymena thermophila SB210]|uniref:Uncharacterized protein n=1 Tax=Tetrahymena thermophila (strain SB210) TaxID=312017 RepID=Q24DK1_TETTS|nr:hypothetical protein TTHERM_00971720 [Tetrahymena thermophila SB210]EAS05847.2 hypothetical protein TTHERM_00971720 [Tetrahymena thermophila SB210]|eukprot:XP_001026092.2 hypothetical protein TTHERM_00971720 [Tetrahymena thermophila SB210]